MKYLFVTLMWNARAEMPAPSDIFAVCCQSYSPNGMTRYGRYTYLDDMSALTQWTKDAVYHNIAALEMAKPRKEILDTVAETFPDYDVLVLWSRKEYELFRQAMHDCGHRLCTAKVVLLEELLGAVVRPGKRGRMPFQQVLRAFHVQTTRETFYQPKYRAGFLLELWDRVSQLAAQSEEWTQTELCLNPRTNTVHLPGCSHLGPAGGQPCTPQVLLEGAALCRDCQKKKALYLWEMERLHAVKFQPHAGALGAPQNYPPAPKLFYREGDPQKLYHDRACPCCKPFREGPGYLQWKPLFGRADAAALGLTACDRCSPLGIRYGQARTQIESFCSQRGMQCVLRDGEIDVTTPIGGWRLVWKGKDKIWLYHKNTHRSHLTESEDIPGYHSQAIHKKTIMEYLEYIVQHDLYRKNSPLPETGSVPAAKPPKPTHRGHGHHRDSKGAKHFQKHKTNKVKVSSLEELQALARQKMTGEEE